MKKKILLLALLFFMGSITFAQQEGEKNNIKSNQLRKRFMAQYGRDFEMVSDYLSETNGGRYWIAKVKPKRVGNFVITYSNELPKNDSLAYNSMETIRHYGLKRGKVILTHDFYVKIIENNTPVTVLLQRPESNQKEQFLKRTGILLNDFVILPIYLGNSEKVTFFNANQAKIEETNSFYLNNSISEENSDQDFDNSEAGLQYKNIVQPGLSDATSSTLNLLLNIKVSGEGISNLNITYQNDPHSIFSDDPANEKKGSYVNTDYAKTVSIVVLNKKKANVIIPFNKISFKHKYNNFVINIPNIFPKTGNIWFGGPLISFPGFENWNSTTVFSDYYPVQTIILHEGDNLNVLNYKAHVFSSIIDKNTMPAVKNIIIKDYEESISSTKNLMLSKYNCSIKKMPFELTAQPAYTRKLLSAGRRNRKDYIINFKLYRDSWILKDLNLIE